MRINHNLASLNTYRSLSANNSASSKSLEKLSSGLRINKSGDDAAGLAISEKMRAQIRGLDQASRNAQDAISLVQTVEGALSETHSILQRMNELAVQSATDTNTAQDRTKLQAEMDQLAKEITRISNTTEFNTQNLLAGGLNDVFHVGGNANQNINLNISAMDAKSLGVAGDIVTTSSTQLANTGVSSISTTSEALNDTYIYSKKTDAAFGAVSQGTLTGTITNDGSAYTGVGDKTVNVRVDAVSGGPSTSISGPELAKTAISGVTTASSTLDNTYIYEKRTDATVGAITQGTLAGALTNDGTAYTGSTDKTFQVKIGSLDSNTYTWCDPTSVDLANTGVTSLVAEQASNASLDGLYFYVKKTDATYQMDDYVGLNVTANGTSYTGTSPAYFMYTDYNYRITELDNGTNSGVGKVTKLEYSTDLSTWKQATADGPDGEFTFEKGVKIQIATDASNFTSATDEQGRIRVKPQYLQFVLSDTRSGDTPTPWGGAYVMSDKTDVTFGVTGISNFKVNFNFANVFATVETSWKDAHASAISQKYSAEAATLSYSTDGSTWSAATKTGAGKFTLAEGVRVDIAADELAINQTGSIAVTAQSLDFELRDSDRTTVIGSATKVYNNQTSAAIGTGAQTATANFNFATAFANAGTSYADAKSSQINQTGGGTTEVTGLSYSTDGGSTYTAATAGAAGKFTLGEGVKIDIAADNGNTVGNTASVNVTGQKLEFQLREADRTTVIGTTKTVYNNATIVELGDNAVDRAISTNFNFATAFAQANVAYGDAKSSKIIQTKASSTTATIGVNGSVSSEAITQKGINISTQAKANLAITTVNSAITTVSTQRSALGAMQNRLEHTINNLGTASENLTSAESRIRDVDMAKEIMEFTKNNILMEAAQSMLAQANQQPQGVLQLLR